MIIIIIVKRVTEVSSEGTGCDLNPAVSCNTGTGTHWHHWRYIMHWQHWRIMHCSAHYALQNLIFKKSDFVEYAATQVLFDPSACSWVHDSVIFTWLLIRLSNVTDVTQNQAFQTRPTTLLPLCPNISATSEPIARPCNCLNVENVT